MMLESQYLALNAIYGEDVVNLALDTLIAHIDMYPESYYERGSEFTPHYWVVSAMCSMFVKGMENQ